MKMSYSTVIPQNLQNQLLEHLVRADGQEDLCFALYNPSTGNSRFSGILEELIFPNLGERKVHGNVGFMPEYLERVLQSASTAKKGIAFLHSHPWPGWQAMSNDDINTESKISPSVFASTGLPLLGLTVGTDGAWSSRFWTKDKSAKRQYNRNWSETVRVLGKGLKITFNDALLKPCFDEKKQLRTISAWGRKSQEDLSRLKIGIVGLGSVGSIVAEILARTGISHFVLIDFDTVEEKNMDRLTNIFRSDIGRSKVLAIKDAIERSATSPGVSVECCEFSICEKEGFEMALDCDIIFSCVDRPWPRQVLNFISYSHLIPVIDGGILVRTNKTNTGVKSADWKAQTVGFQRVCLECTGQYSSENVLLEKQGSLDDPSYMQGAVGLSHLNSHENVFVFSSHLASMEVLQMLNLFLSPLSFDDVGQQVHHFVNGTQDTFNELVCHPNCFFPGIAGKGDLAGITIYDRHEVAEKERLKRTGKIEIEPVKLNFLNRVWLRIKNLFQGHAFDQ